MGDNPREGSNTICPVLHKGARTLPEDRKTSLEQTNDNPEAMSA